MARKPNRNKGPKKAKKKSTQQSQQTKMKRQLASKRRVRGPKGSAYGGRFMGGAHKAEPPYGEKGKTRASRSVRSGKGTRVVNMQGNYRDPSIVRERAQEYVADAKLKPPTPEEHAFYKTAYYTGGTPQREDVATPPVRVSKVDTKRVERARRANWRTEPGLYEQPGAQRGPGRKQYTPLSKFIKNDMADDHREWLLSEMKNPNSEFNRGISTERTTKALLNPAQRHRAQTYVNALQEGRSHAEAMDLISTERRGRPTAPHGATDTDGRTRIQEQMSTGGVGMQVREGRKNRYQDLTPAKHELPFGRDARAVDDLATIGKKFPGSSLRQQVRLQEQQKETIFDELLRNNTWAHETRAANLKGDPSLKEQAKANRVVFFTTNIGGPAPSVPADSLVGQYIVRRRKKMVSKEGIAKGKALDGRFPDAVRDMHLLEFSTGLSIGAVGQAAVFNHSGYRTPNKKSRGFGKPVPIGSQLLTDSQGRPVYDEAGNVRFSEGIAKPFQVGTERPAGLRIFIG